MRWDACTAKRQRQQRKFAYDNLGRVVTHTSPIGTFTRGYMDYTDRLSSSLLSGSTIGTNYYYHQNSNGGVWWLSVISPGPGIRNYYLDTNAENQVTEVDLKGPGGKAR